jgi:hypothetical protein
MIGNLLYTESVLNSIKKELKGIYPDLKVTNEEIVKVLQAGVIKREITEGEESDEAKKKILKTAKKKEKVKADASAVSSITAEVQISNELPSVPLD